MSGFSSLEFPTVETKAAAWQLDSGLLWNAAQEEQV